MSAEQLQRIYHALQQQEQQALLYFAEFLQQNSAPAAEQEKQEPLDIPRPQQEKVIHALRRLAQTYPMLKHEALLRQGADLMSSHFVTGRPAAEVIDELEEIFLRHYQAYLER
jgi:hypothetical protein